MVNEVANLIAAALVTASLSLFLQKCYEPGMILRRYYLWLNLLWIRWRLKPKGDCKCLLSKRSVRSILKPMGLCVYCQNAWIAIAASTAVDGHALRNCLAVVALSYVFLELLYKTIKK